MSLLSNGDWMVLVVNGDHLIRKPALYPTREAALSGARAERFGVGVEVIVSQVIAYGVGRSTVDWKETVTP